MISPGYLCTSGERPPQVGGVLRIRGRRVHALLMGEGEPSLLLHGNCGLGQEILSVFGHCKGVFWIAPDRPGYGLNEPLRRGQEVPVSQACWQARLLDSLKVPAAHVVAIQSHPAWRSVWPTCCRTGSCL
jgi:hypothetical protein